MGPLRGRLLLLGGKVEKVPGRGLAFDGLLTGLDEDGPD